MSWERRGGDLIYREEYTRRKSVLAETKHDLMEKGTDDDAVEAAEDEIAWAHG